MTAEEAKKLTLWMQSHGVTHFAFDGLQVAFHTRSVKVKERNTGARGAAPEGHESHEARIMAGMFPLSGMPYAESQ